VPAVFMQTPIRSPPALSRTWRGQAAMPRDTQIEYGDQRKMVGGTQRDRVARDANGGPSRSRHTRRVRPVSLIQSCGAIAQGSRWR
jgi:hypothetical protein